MDDIRKYGLTAIQYARRIIEIYCVAGRPYHVDKEVNHGIDQLIQLWAWLL